MALRNIAIDRDTGGFIFSGDQLQFVSDAESIRQAVRIRLKTIRGEFFLDPTLGVPWFDDVFIKNPDVRVIVAMLREEITGVRGVKDVVSMDFNFDKSSRALEISFQATTDVGLLADSTTVTV